jgi:parallel beta-helix repeat protein
VVLWSGCAAGFTGSPSRIGHTDAILHGHVLSNSGGDIESWYQYGPTASYGSETTHETVENWPAQQALSVSILVDGLQGSKSYHYRLCARDDQQQGGAGCGEDRVFTTQQVDCGETLTGDVKLTGPMACNEPAFIIGADGVDIDLAGHGLIGNWHGLGGPIAVDNLDGFDDLTIHDGNVNGFGFLLWAKDASRNRVINVAAAAESRAVELAGGEANEIHDSDLFGDRLGVASTDSNGLVVAHSRVASSGPAINATGNSVRILHNEVIRSPGADLDRGIELRGNGGRIEGNQVRNWALGGIVVAGSSNALIDNDVHDSVHSTFDPRPAWDGDGIYVSAFSAGTLLRSNTVSGNVGDGIETRDSSSSLGLNTASNNGDYGIEAVPGVIDLGFNSEFGNGNPAGCLNVFCE